MRKGPSDNLIAFKAISLCADLSAIEKRVCSLIIDHHNRKTGQCDPSLETMARLLGVSRRTIIRGINSLVSKGYLARSRHGGKFHRNQYEPQWARFRIVEENWSSRRRKNSSPLQRQSCHVEGDTSVTQTTSKNLFKETCCLERPPIETELPRSRIVDQGLSKVRPSTPQRFVANERFHVKTPSSRDAARDAAERRWNAAFMKQLTAAPDVFENMVDAIDDELHRATTEMELRKVGAGLPYLLSELDRRSPLQCASSTGNPPNAKGPSWEVSPAGNSDRGGSPVRPDFESLKTKLNSLNSEPKQAGALEKTSRNSVGGGGPQAGQEESEVGE